jgi:8-oxo-dGTP pyrophosphatase MutT (NUDIX family)
MTVVNDREELPVETGGQSWSVSWHAPATPPNGRNHGAAGICVSDEDLVVIVSHDGKAWDVPAGRPEEDESLEETLRREVMEEACAAVRSAQLLGFARSTCLRGHEEGLVLVRSFWCAEVTVHPWKPEFEVTHRELVPARGLVERLGLTGGLSEILRRALHEARLL